MSTINFDIFARDHNASKTFDKVGDSAQGVSGRIDGVAKRFDRSSAVIASASALAGTAVLAFGKNSIDAASDQNEALSKSTVIFGDQAAAVEKWAGTAAKSMGMSKTEALSASASFGDMFLQLGFAGDAAADMSKQVVQMSADLGSFNNLPTAEVVDMISASFRGEYDSLQRVIPNINAARVQTEAMAQTGKKNAKELNAQEKAAATLSIVMKDGARAQGDFARTADGAANKARITTARFEDMQAVLGQKLLPVWNGMLDVATLSIDTFTRLIDVVGSIPAPVMAAVAGLTAFHLLSGPLGRFGTATLGVLGALRESFGYAQQAAARAGGGIRGFTAGVQTMTGVAHGGRAALIGLFSAVAPAAVFMAATAALTGWIQAQQNARRAGEELADTLDRQTGAFTELTRQKFLEKFFADFSQEDYAKVRAMLDGAKVGVADLIAAYEQGGPAVDAFKARFDNWRATGPGGALDANTWTKVGNAYAALGRDMELGKVIWQENAAATDKVAAATGSASAKAQAASPNMQALGTDVAGVGKEATTTADAIKALALASLEVTNAAMGADAAHLAYKDSLDAARTAAEENGKATNKARTAFDTNSEAGRNNSKALQGLARDALASAKANLETGQSAELVTKKLTGSGGARDAFIATARKMGLNQDAAEKLATKYGLTKDSVNNLKGSMDKIPKKVKSEILVEHGQAISRVESIKRALKMIPDERVNVFIDTVNRSSRGVSYGVQERASGGRYEAGPVLVGENGPELRFEDEPGYIVNAADTARLLAAAKHKPSPSAGSGDGGTETIAPLLLQVEGETLVKVLLKIKRTRGGVELGIA